MKSYSTSTGPTVSELHASVEVVYDPHLLKKNPLLFASNTYARAGFDIKGVNCALAKDRLSPTDQAKWPYDYVWSFDVVIEELAAFQLTLGSPSMGPIEKLGVGESERVRHFLLAEPVLYISGCTQMLRGMQQIAEVTPGSRDDEGPKFDGPEGKGPKGPKQSPPAPAGPTIS